MKTSIKKTGKFLGVPKPVYRIKNDRNLLYKYAVICQIRVNSFFNSNLEGIIDFRGPVSRLDDIAKLGVNVVWLLPFNPLPMRDDGYDIADYMDVNPAFGTLADFKQFVREVCRRDLRVITELVIKHTSDQHPWFQRAPIHLSIGRRLASLREGDRRKIMLLNVLRMSMPRTPMIHHGDEIGVGDTLFLGDRNGVRAPMQWSSDRDGGFSPVDPQSLFLPPIMDPVYG